MKSRMSLNGLNLSTLHQISIPRPIFVQDTIHLATKLRNRYLNTSILLQMGNMIVTIGHLKMLLAEVPKEKHGLVLTDISPDDRQNFSSFEKITDNRVFESLENHIVDSDATVMYLDLCKKATSSFLDVYLDPIERIYRIWNAVYFFRCWRKWIQSQNNEFSLAKNFISRNAYSCLEINAHALIYLIVSLRISQQNELLMTDLFSSQPCEHTFRQMRSMGTANYTKINFNLHELLHMVARLEILDKIVYSSKDIIFPRVELKSKNAGKVMEKLSVHKFPNDEDILSAMNRAKIDALQSAARFDMCCNETDIDLCELQSEINSNEETEIEEDYFGLIEQSIAYEARNENDSVNEMEKTVDIVNPDGTTKNIRKSTLIWLLSESKDKLSADRLKRVQAGPDSDKKSKRFKPNLPESNVSALGLTPAPHSTQYLSQQKELGIGEWAIFGHESIDDKNADNDFMNSFLFGFVVGFRFPGKQNNKSYVIINPETDMKSVGSNKSSGNNDVQVHCIWYTFDETGVLQLIRKVQKLVYIKQYLATMKNPSIKRSDSGLQFVLPCEYSQLKDELAQTVTVKD